MPPRPPGGRPPAAAAASGAAGVAAHCDEGRAAGTCGACGCRGPSGDSPGDDAPPGETSLFEAGLDNKPVPPAALESPPTGTSR